MISARGQLEFLREFSVLQEHGHGKAAGSLSLGGTSSLGVRLFMAIPNGIFGVSSPAPQALCGVVSPLHPSCTKGGSAGMG